MRISDWSSDVCYSDLLAEARIVHHAGQENLVIGLHAAFPDHADLDFVASAVRLVNLIDGGAVALSILDASHDKVGKAHLAGGDLADNVARSEEHTSELQSLMRISDAVFSLKKKRKKPVVPQLNNTHI